MFNHYYKRRVGPGSTRGFTLMELMVVCAIISILAAMSFALLTRARTQAIETNALAALNTLATSYEMFYFHNTRYPQWGMGEQFASSRNLFDYLISEDYLAPSYSHYEYDSATGYIFGFTQDYAVDIKEYDPLDPTTSSRNSYFIVFHPYNFQRDALAIGTNPPTGWVAVRPRRGREGSNYRNYGLFVFKRVGSE